MSFWKTWECDIYKVLIKKTLILKDMNQMEKKIWKTGNVLFIKSHESYFSLTEKASSSEWKLAPLQTKWQTKYLNAACILQHLKSVA